MIEERKDYHKETNGRFLTGFTEDPNQTEGGSDVGGKRLMLIDYNICDFLVVATVQSSD